MLECGIIRFHQQRKYVLDTLRLLLEVEQLDDEDDGPSPMDAVRTYVSERLFQQNDRLAQRCLRSMGGIKAWLSTIADKLAAVQTLGSNVAASAEVETIEFSRLSLIQQHEALGVILCRAVEQRQAEKEDLTRLLNLLKRAERYDSLLGEHSWSDLDIRYLLTKSF